MGASATGDESVDRVMRRAGRPAWVTRLVLVVVAVLVTVVVVRLVGRIDWASVWDALSRLAWWHLPALGVVLVFRQVLKALPLALYIPGVSVYRAAINDLGAILISVLAPPPSEAALRMTMFTSWAVPVAKGLAGTLMNALTFYIVRFSAPLAGFALLALVGRRAGLRWLEVLFIAIALAILLGVLLVVRSEQLARTVGRTTGRLARRVRHSVDPHAWAQWCLDFRTGIAARFRSGFPRSFLALCGMVAADLALLVLCLRFVGVDGDDAGVADVAIAYLFAYPFTLFPFSGLGVVDALILAALVEAGGLKIEAASVAALIVWRVFTVAGPVVMGVAALTVWRRAVPGRGSIEG